MTYVYTDCTEHTHPAGCWTRKENAMTYTPGPWTIQRYKDGQAAKQQILVHGPKPADAFLADVYSGNGSRDMEANARLIAAAPELLTALQVLTDHAGEMYPHFESERGQRDIAAAVSAIAKATCDGCRVGLGEHRDHAR